MRLRRSLRKRKATTDDVNDNSIVSSTATTTRPRSNSRANQLKKKAKTLVAKVSNKVSKSSSKSENKPQSLASMDTQMATFLQRFPEQQQNEADRLLQLFLKATNLPAEFYSSCHNIVGFGKYTYER